MPHLTFLRTVSAVLASAVLLLPFGPAADADEQGQASCGLDQPAFCDTFKAPAGIGNRSGQLDGVVWGVSHVSGEDNYGGPSNGWGQAPQTVCGSPQVLAPGNDVFVCDGLLVEGQDDSQGVTGLALYPKQPFDFAGRTGKVTFDVSNDSQGSHAAWPEFWITDKPIPAPHSHEASLHSLPQNGFGLRFSGFADANGHGASCPEGSPAYVGVNSALTVSNYVLNDTDNGGHLALHGMDCVRASTAPNQLNHYEIDVSQNQIDVFGTDAGTSAPLKHLATIANANLSFTRGLIWIEDSHYNGNKFNSQGTHMFTWANVGFDGPLLPRDLAYDVNDSLTPSGKKDPNNGMDVLNTGWYVPANGSQTFTVNDVVDPNVGSGALFEFGFWYAASPPFSIGYAINGHEHTLAWPYPETESYTPRTIAVPLDLAELRAGTNTLTISPPVPMNVFNIDLIMVGAGGVVPPAAGAGSAT